MGDNGLLKPETKLALENIIGQCFINNRHADRIASILGVTYVMPYAANEIHHRIAHMYLNVHGADGIGEYMDSRNATVIYQETLIGNQEYTNPIECFETLLKNQLDLETKVYQAIKVADMHNDIMTKGFLQSFMIDLIPYTDVILLLLDKANQYNISDSINAAKFDNDIYKFGIYKLEVY